MYGIDLLMKEHENIVALTKHLRRTCCAVMRGQTLMFRSFWSVLICKNLCRQASSWKGRTDIVSVYA